MSPADLEAFEDYNGNISAVFRARQAVVEGRDEVFGVPIAEHLRQGWRDARPVALRTLQAAFRAQMTPAERAYWREGSEGRRRMRTYSQRQVACRNAVWQVDHTQLDIEVLPPHGPVCRPWLTSFLDHRHRVLMGWVIALHPDQGVVAAALRSAIVADPDDGRHGGLPSVIEHDRAWEFGARALRAACGTLQIDLRPRPPRTPRFGGVVERWHGTIDRLLLCQLPGYTGGARDGKGRLFGPVRDDRSWREHAGRPSPDGEDHVRDDRDAAGTVGDDQRDRRAVTLRAFIALFARFAVAYNQQHPHPELDGLTPLQSWQADPSPLSTVDEALLRDLLLQRRDSVMVTSKGIRFENLHYLVPDLQVQGMVGERVQIRYAPHDRRFVEVYQDGRHLGTAYPAQALTPEQNERRRQAWSEEGRQLGARRRKANQRARRRLEPLNRATGDPQDTLPAAVTAARAPSTPLRGSASLLDLRDPLTLLDAAATTDTPASGPPQVARTSGGHPIMSPHRGQDRISDCGVRDARSPEEGTRSDA
ncbi:transposase family protein [Lentzea sp. NPDC003310]|uniref:transposase family protein n=1 Tax=Lentzea sp. NPDC003310 TaxID=3154447 RepID=UPI0033BD2B90